MSWGSSSGQRFVPCGWQAGGILLPPSRDFRFSVIHCLLDAARANSVFYHSNEAICRDIRQP